MDGTDQYASVRYIVDINDYYEFFGKILGPLSRGESVKRDIIVRRFKKQAKGGVAA